MRLIILRHGIRGPVPTFMTSLTSEGLEQVKKLEEKLALIEIDEIYCSPFLRTVQTIYPYCIKMNKKVNIDNGIYECTHNKYFTPENYKGTIKDFEISHNHLHKIINKDYKSYIKLDEIECNENFYQIRDRIFNFINYLMDLYKNTNKTVLLVTHMASCNLIKRYFNEKTEINDHFEMGDFEIINNYVHN